MSYSLNDKFSIDTKTATAKLDGNLEVRNYISYKTNNNTVNLSAAIVPNTYELVNIASMVSTPNSLTDGNITIGNPYVKTVETSSKEFVDSIFEFYNLSSSESITVHIPTDISPAVSILPNKNVHTLVSFYKQTEELIRPYSSNVDITVELEDTTRTYCTKILRDNEDRAYILYATEKLVSLGNYRSVLRVIYSSGTFYYRFVVPTIGSYLRITDIAVVSSTNLIITGFYRNDTGTIRMQKSTITNNEGDYIDVINSEDVFPNTLFQTNIFVLSIDSTNDTLLWGRYIVGLQNDFPNNLDARVILTEEGTRVVLLTYIRTENQRVSIYKRDVGAGNTISYSLDQTILGTDLNDTNEFLVLKFVAHTVGATPGGTLERHSRIIPTTLVSESYTGNPQDKPFYELTALGNGHFAVYIKNSATVPVSYRVINADKSYKLGIDYQNGLIYYNNLLYCEWTVNIINKNTFTSHALTTIETSKVLLKTAHLASSNIPIYNFDNSTYTILPKDTNYEAFSASIIYNIDGTVYNVAYVKHATVFTDTTHHSISALTNTDYLSYFRNVDINYLYVDSFTNEYTEPATANAYVVDAFKYNQTNPYKIFRVGEDVDKTILNTDTLYVSGDLQLGGKVSSDFFLNTDNSKTRNNLQLKSRRLVYQVEGAASSNFQFVYEGLYKIEPNDVELFLNGYKLCYQDDTKFDYTVGYETYQTSNTLFTITLIDEAKYGDILDITIWPSYLSSNAVMQPGYVLQNIVTDFFTEGKQNIFHLGAVGIGTTFAEKTLDVEGGIVVSDNYYIKIGSVVRPLQESPFIPIVDNIPNNYYLPENTTIGIGTTFPKEALHLYRKTLYVESGKIVVGNIGIGTSSPIQPFHIHTNSYIHGSIGIGTTLPRQKLDMEEGDFILVGNIGIGTTQVSVGLYNQKDTVLLGNVGIGTTSPQKAMDILGDMILLGNLGIGTVDTSLGKLVINGSIIPTSTSTHDIGSSNLRFRDIYLSGSSIDLGGTKITRDTTTGGIQVLNTEGKEVNLQAASVYVSSNVGIGTTFARQVLDVQGPNGIFSGNLGIGTTLPREKLDVWGNIQANFFKGNGSLLTDLPVGQWTVSGTQMYYTSGNVGIGTSSPQSQLDVYGTAIFRNGNVGLGTTMTQYPLDIRISPYITVPGNEYFANMNAYFENSRYPPSALSFSTSETSNLPGLTVVYPAAYMTNNTTTVNTALYTSGIGTYTASASSTGSGSAYYVFRDVSYSSSWRSSTSRYSSTTGAYTYSPATTTVADSVSYTGEYVQLQCPNAFVLTKYEVKKTTNANAYKFYVFGSIDGSTWTLLSTQEGSWAGTLTKTIPSPTLSANYYRIVVNVIDTAVTYAEIGQWSLFGIDTIQNVPVKVSATYTSSTYPYNQGTYVVGMNNGYAIESYYDTRPLTTNSFSSRITGLLNAGSSTTYTSEAMFTNTTDASTPVYISVAIPAIYPISKYEITGPSTTGYAPNKWRLYGSMNNSTWQLIETRTSISFTTGETKSFTLSPTVQYTYFRWEFLRNNSGTAAPVSFKKIYIYGPNTKSVVQITHNGTSSTNPIATITTQGDLIVSGTTNTTYVDVGYASQTRETNAGKIAYQVWSSGLDIIGAGTTTGTRLVKLWDKVDVPGEVNALGFTRYGGIRFADRHYGSGVARHMAFIRNGDLFACGLNSYGQLGTGVASLYPIFPKRIQWTPKNGAKRERVVSVRVSYFNTFFLTTDTDGTNYIYAMGDNGNYQIGNGTTTDALVPYRIEVNSDNSAVLQPVSIFLSEGYTGGVGARTLMYINAEGNLYIWGVLRQDGSTTVNYTKPTLFPLPPNNGTWKGAVTDGYSIQAWTSDATGNALYAMGYNGRGALANGTTTNSIGTWVACVDANSTPITNISKVIIGGRAVNVSTYYALTNTGTLYSWGQNNVGSVGIGNTTTPVTLGYNLTTAIGDTIVDVVAGGGYTGNGNISATVLTSTGNLYVWGDADTGNGISNTDTSSPQLVTLPSGAGTAVKIRGGGNRQTYFYIDVNGNAYGVGKNVGQLGIGNATDFTTYQQVLLQEACEDIYVQYYYYTDANGSDNFSTVFFQGVSGRIYSSGVNAQYNCGEGSTNTIYVPTEVMISL